MKLKTRNKSLSIIKKAFLSLAVIALVLTVAVTAINSVQQSRKEENAKIIETGVRRAAMECYANEGFFPNDIGYLIENYQLYTDSDNCIIHYKATSSNIMPEIRVISK